MTLTRRECFSFLAIAPLTWWPHRATTGATGRWRAVRWDHALSPDRREFRMTVTAERDGETKRNTVVLTVAPIRPTDSDASFTADEVVRAERLAREMLTTWVEQLGVGT